MDGGVGERDVAGAGIVVEEDRGAEEDGLVGRTKGWVDRREQ